ncbi:site-2 protease family protein [Galactobacter caseinivorans]|uniref:site-2 protease family protein n=1 Tax=Galactobacter caseinivorans TaxID=2676123 RepID=UPI001314C6B3|nr:site-2 protease family protein [Galactobacter caseinivorans]
MSATPTPARPWFDRPLSLGSVAGVPVALSTSWLLITVGMVALFTPRILESLPTLSWVAAAAVALAYAVILAISVLLHEVAHALAARSVGWTGSSIEITLWGGHTSFREVDSTPGRSLYVSLVGPLVNLVIGGVGLLLMQGQPLYGVPGLLLSMAVYSNLAVGIFNVLPALPLDGGRIVESLVWQLTGSQAKGTIAGGWAGRILVGLGVVALAVFWVRGAQGPSLILLVLAVVVLLPIWQGASAALKHGRLRLSLEQVNIEALMSPVEMVPAGTSVAGAIEVGVLDGTVILAMDPERQHLLRVMPEAVLAVPEQLRAGTPVTRAGVPADDAGVVTLGSNGDALVRAVVESVSGTVLVVDQDGQCIGAVRREVVIAAIEGRVRKESQK